MAIEIPDSAAFYVRGSLNRALEQARETLELSQQAIDSPDCDNMTRVIARGNKRHIGQWYKEATKEFRKFPESIKPDSDLLDYDPWKSTTQEG